jgi:hypothetical protein
MSSVSEFQDDTGRVQTNIAPFSPRVPTSEHFQVHGVLIKYPRAIAFSMRTAASWLTW